MRTKQKTSLTQNTKHHIRQEILTLLEDEKITRNEIFHSVQAEHEVTTSEFRAIVREIRTEFLHKLDVLQSGIVRL